MKNNIHYLLLLLTQLFITSILAQEEPIILKTPTGEIIGTLSTPLNKTKGPIVLIIAGSGPTDRNGNQPSGDNNSLKFLANELAKNNIASVRFDKRGIAESQEAMREEGEIRFDTYVTDVKEWVNLISKDKRFDKIIIAGHSEGSLIGMIASQKNKKVNGFISIAGAGRPADEIIKEQMVKYPQNIKDIIFPMIEKIKKGDSIPNVPPMLSSLFRPSVQPYMTSWFKYNPQTEIKKLNIPVLLLQGTTDLQVKEEDAELLAKAQPMAEKKIIKNMNHVLKNCETLDKELQKPIYENDTLQLNKDFVNETILFIKKIK